MTDRLPPVEQLTRSRERLRMALRSTSTTPPSAQRAGAGAGSAPSAWPEFIQSIPGSGLVLGALGVWWAQHPWRVAAQVAAAALEAALAPTARRHPLGLVAGAFLAGGLLFWLRPWRALPTSALLGTVLPQILAQAAAQTPQRSGLELLLAVLAQSPKPTDGA